MYRAMKQAQTNGTQAMKTKSLLILTALVSSTGVYAHQDLAGMLHAHPHPGTEHVLLPVLAVIGLAAALKVLRRDR